MGPRTRRRDGARTGARSGGRQKDDMPSPGTQFTSPWTGKVYDRWAPIGLAGKGENQYRQSGLGAARAYETPIQRQIKEALNPEGERKYQEWEKYAPGMAPAHLLPPEKKKKELVRHACRAGNFSDIFKQLLVQTVIDLKVSKKETPLWYVETCGGEGEYHVGRLKKKGEIRKPMLWPTAEILYEALLDKDMKTMPAEIQGWFEAMQFLNTTREDFEAVGSGAEPGSSSTVDGRARWLPSTALVALRRLRKQDPATIFEDNPVSFAALYNFVRNFSSEFEPHVEISVKDGFKMVRRIFCERKDDSQAHGRFKSQRGFVFMDPDYTRGSEAQRCQDMVSRLRKHWRSATVMMTYPLRPDFEHKARKINMEIRDRDPGLDLLTAEMYVYTPDWTPESEAPKWRGCGALISSPPYTSAERMRAALGCLKRELQALPGAHKIKYEVEKLR